MALNIAVPLSGLGGLSEIPPIGIDCWENIKILVSPIGSESSGVSSLDSEEAKQQIKLTPPRKPDAIKPELRIYYNGRNVLDLYNNVETNSATWKFRYSHLPEKNNISMFWANRSLYNRLGPNGLTPAYTINKCECCDFQYTSDCPNSYLSETSLNMSSTTTSPMIFTTASTKKQEYHATKVTCASAQFSSSATSATNQQSFTGYKSSFELPNKQFYNQNNVNKAKFNDVFFKKTNNLASMNTSYTNLNKFNNPIGTTKTTNEISSHFSTSPSNTSPPNLMMGYNSSNAIHHNNCNELITNNSKCNVPQNFFNTSLTSNSTPPVAANHNFNNNNINTNNGILPNSSNTNNSSSKSQISSSNNFYSLFNSSNTNISAIYAFNANGNSNSNSYMNSFNSMSNSSNNINSNPLTVNSQHYGRMYKYF